MFNPGNAIFANLRKNQCFIDKSMLIEHTNAVVSTEENCILMVRPRRFGKTKDLQMLQAYYDRSVDSSFLFDDLKIARTPDYRTHLNSYPVITINLVNYSYEAHTMDDIKNAIKNKLYRQLLRYYDGIDDSEELSEILESIYMQTGEKFILLVDEVDSILRDDDFDLQVKTQYLKYLENLIKDKPYFALVYATGILPFDFYGRESSINCFSTYTIAEPRQLSRFMGFSEEDVKALCVQHDMDFGEMKKWYDGYLVSGNSAYNPKSVIEAIRGRTFYSYWTKTGTFDKVEKYILKDGKMIEDFDSLMLGTSIPMKITSCKLASDGILTRNQSYTSLVYLGYLSYDEKSKTASIPNREIEGAFVDFLEECENYAGLQEALAKSQELLEATWDLDEKRVCEIIEDIHDEEACIYYNNENSLACLLRLAYYSAKAHYEMVREYRSGKGYADLAFIPKGNKIPMIVEIKWNKNTKIALEQIKQRNYYKRLKQYDNVLLVGINYDDKSKIHSCAFERRKL